MGRTTEGYHCGGEGREGLGRKTVGQSNKHQTEHPEKKQHAEKEISKTTVKN